MLEQEPIVIQKAKTRSYIGAECERLIKEFLMKLGNPEKEMAVIFQNRIADMNSSLKDKDSTIYMYMKTGE